MDTANLCLEQKKYGKLGPAEIPELRQLRDERAHLRRLVGESVTEPLRSSDISERDRGSAWHKMAYFPLYSRIPV